MKTILFICTGNICRSPMAEGIFRHIMKGRRDIQVMSAGIGAMEGQAPSPYAVQAVKELGIDISKQRSRQLTGELVQEADYIFGMTHSHVDTVLLLYPHAAEKTFLLREFDDTLDIFEKDISDPIGGSYDVYLNTRDQIEQGIASLMRFIDQGEISAAPDQATTPAALFALGADHGGFELKEILRQHLAAEGISVIDLGAHSPAPTDYPDFALAVAQTLLNRKAELGLLICTTGVGMCMTANRVPGIRAAQVFEESTARLARQHNNANVLCLGAKVTPPETAKKIVDAFLSAHFEGGRHERRLIKMETIASSNELKLKAVDPEIADAIASERRRQQENIELIASENFTSPAVMEAQGSVLTNKYAEGYPKKRWYGGCENVDVVEQLAIDRALKVFGAEHANVQPHSGSGANMAVYFAFLKPGDKMLTMNLAHGGHLTHGHPANFSGKFYQVTHYGVDEKTEQIDYDALQKQAEEVRPVMITAGASAYPRIIDFPRLRQIADSVGAILFIDMAHIAGLVAGGQHPSPIPHAHFVTTTTHKSLRGPRGGIIMCEEKFAKQIDATVFPGVQGGPLMHVIAAKAVCFHEALLPQFREYQRQVVVNAKALAAGLAKHGYRIVSGGTDNHLMLVDLRPKEINGKEAQEVLDRAGITVNKNGIPFDTYPIFKPGGIRVGTPAVTTRGMKEEEMLEIADLVAEALANRTDEAALGRVREKVREMTRRFPLPA